VRGFAAAARLREWPRAGVQRTSTGVSRSSASACAARAVRRAVRSRHVDPRLHAHTPARSSDEQSVDAALGFEEEWFRGRSLVAKKSALPCASLKPRAVVFDLRDDRRATCGATQSLSRGQRAAYTARAILLGAASRAAAHVLRSKLSDAARAERTLRASRARTNLCGDVARPRRARPTLLLTRRRTPLATCRRSGARTARTGGRMGSVARRTAAPPAPRRSTESLPMSRSLRCFRACLVYGVAAALLWLAFSDEGRRIDPRANVASRGALHHGGAMP